MTQVPETTEVVENIENVEEIQEFEPILHHFIEAGFKLVISDATFMTVVMGSTVFFAVVIIVVDYFNRRGRRY